MIRSNMLSPSSGSKSTLNMKDVFFSETLALISNIMHCYSLENDQLNSLEFQTLIMSKIFTMHTVINHSLLYNSVNNPDKVVDVF
jgi:hypothetical protein